MVLEIMGKDNQPKAACTVQCQPVPVREVIQSSLVQVQCFHDQDQCETSVTTVSAMGDNGESILRVEDRH
jgi:hypothetical protein